MFRWKISPSFSKSKKNPSKIPASKHVASNAMYSSETSFDFQLTKGVLSHEILFFSFNRNLFLIDVHNPVFNQEDVGLMAAEYWKTVCYKTFSRTEAISLQISSNCVQREKITSSSRPRISVINPWLSAVFSCNISCQQLGRISSQEYTVKRIGFLNIWNSAVEVTIQTNFPYIYS